MDANQVLSENSLNPTDLITPGRKIVGMSAILLPFTGPGEIDWQSFEEHVHRTVEAGLIPAVNMDTGYAHLIDEPTRIQALSIAERLTANSNLPYKFVAGAYVSDQPGNDFDCRSYLDAISAIETKDGLPIVFQSYGLTNGADAEILKRYQSIAENCERFLAFELGQMFAPFGKIYSLELYRELISLSSCIGLKHSSLDRNLEWQRLQIRNHIRPPFLQLTGNDLAIDMVMYGCDYLLGLSTFCPDLFARRDAYWADSDNRFYELNDVLQHLGFLAFRTPTPAYKHSAAMFLKLRNWIKTDLTHPDSPQRPDSDRDLLRSIAQQLGLKLDEAG